jgi:pimeloyl-ACP methyl ester carboxylesterase
MQQGSPQPEVTAAFVDVLGARMHYLHAGTGHPMLLFHGLVGSSANWSGNIPALAQHASVYAIDVVNMGKSQRVDGLDPSLKAAAKRIVAAMDALGIADADIVAHSHGGSVALMLAARYPLRVRRLILFAPANPYSNSSDLMVRVYSTPWGRFAARILPYLPARLQRAALGDLYGGPDRIVDSCLQEYVEVLRNSASLRHVLSTIGCWLAEMAKLKRALRRVARVPTLLVWGDRDCTVSLTSGIKLNRKLRRSELIVIPGGTHSVFQEIPNEANRVMLEWLVRHPLSAPLPTFQRSPSTPRPRTPRRSTAAAKTTPSTAAPPRLSPETQ